MNYFTWLIFCCEFSHVSFKTAFWYLSFRTSSSKHLTLNMWLHDSVGCKNIYYISFCLKILWPLFINMFGWTKISEIFGWFNTWKLSGKEDYSFINFDVIARLVYTDLQISNNFCHNSRVIKYWRLNSEQWWTQTIFKKWLI